MPDDLNELEELFGEVLKQRDNRVRQATLLSIRDGILQGVRGAGPDANQSAARVLREVAETLQTLADSLDVG